MMKSVPNTSQPSFALILLLWLNMTRKFKILYCLIKESNVGPISHNLVPVKCQEAGVIRVHGKAPVRNHNKLRTDLN